MPYSETLINVEIMRIARCSVKADIRKAREKVSNYSPEDISNAAKALIDAKGAEFRSRAIRIIDEMHRE